MNNLHKKTPLIAVVGFTASGKTELSIALAQQFKGEIIAADAVTVYKRFDIGSAKPTQKQMSEIQHHLVDITEPDAGFSAADFQQHANKAIAEIAGRGNVPLLVGGSGLYIDSILFDYNFQNQSNPDMREILNKKSLSELLSIAHEKVLPLDTIDAQNKRRVIRLIETDGQTSSRKPLRKNTLVIGINTPKELLRQRVVKRVDSMLGEGLEQEVKTLYKQYGWEIEPMRSIGYREWRPYFENMASREEIRQQIITHTMQLIKKQRTWFKRNPHIHWVNNKNDAVAHVTTFLST